MQERSSLVSTTKENKMKFGQFNCSECGANVCGDAVRHIPVCPKCGVVGSWDKVTENDLVNAMDMDSTPNGDSKMTLRTNGPQQMMQETTIEVIAASEGTA